MATQYVIRPNDSLDKIAQQYNTTPQDIMKLNPSITNPNLIYTGATLNIPDNTDVGASGTALQPTAQSTVTPTAQNTAPATPPTTTPATTSTQSGSTQTNTGTTAGTNMNPSVGTQTSPTTPQAGQGVDDNTFLGLLNNLNTGLQQNNQFVTAKTAVVNAMLGTQPTAAQLATLPPDVQKIIQSGDRGQMMLEAQVLNDQISGYGKSVASSIQYLTSGYQTAQQRYDTESTNLLNWSKAYNIAPSKLVQTVAPDVWASMTPDQQAQFDKIGAPLLSTTQVPTFSSGSGFPDGANTPGSAASVNNATGIKDPSTGQFQTFSNPQDSIQATVSLLDNYQSGTNSFGINGNTTLADATNMYTTGNVSTQGGYTGQDIANDLGVSADTPISQLDPTEWANAIATHETGYSASNATVTATPPDPSTANVPDSYTGLTPNGIYQAALDWAFGGKMIPTGIGTQPIPRAIRAAVVNKAAAIASAAGTNFPAMQALYKANASAAKQNVERLARVESVMNATQMNFPRLENLADTVKSQGINLTEADIQSGATAVLSKFGSPEAASYVELINTIRSDYSAAQAALAGSRGGQFFAQNASQAIPIGLTSAQYDAIKNTLVLSSTNATTAINEEVSNLLGTSGSISQSNSSSNTSGTLSSGLTYTVN